MRSKPNAWPDVSAWQPNETANSPLDEGTQTPASSQAESDTFQDRARVVLLERIVLEPCVRRTSEWCRVRARKQTLLLEEEYHGSVTLNVWAGLLLLNIVLIDKSEG